MWAMSICLLIPTPALFSHSEGLYLPPSRRFLRTWNKELVFMWMWTGKLVRVRLWVARLFSSLFPWNLCCWLNMLFLTTRSQKWCSAWCGQNQRLDGCCVFGKPDLPQRLQQSLKWSRVRMRWWQWWCRADFCLCCCCCCWSWHHSTKKNKN